ncbi:MAG: hypothetical protein V7K14_28420 [Nostoc sp.]|uniref:hypothetical protein n=1 Tax=Nostoc sp. TaxID=1180 RepID=UPI002FFA42ED
MSQVLSLELSDQVYAALQQQAEVTGVSLAELVAISIEQQYGSLKPKKSQTEIEKEAARQPSEVMLEALTSVTLQE